MDAGLTALYRRGDIEARAKFFVTSLVFRSPPWGRAVRPRSQSRLLSCWLNDRAPRYVRITIVASHPPFVKERSWPAAISHRSFSSGLTKRPKPSKVTAIGRNRIITLRSLQDLSDRVEPRIRHNPAEGFVA